MAQLGSAQVVKQWENGASDKTALYALRKVTTADTADLSADFSVVKQAIALGTTVNGQASVSVSGVTATMPAGLSNDAGYMLVWGCSA
jgi:hypothetical protein